MNHHSSHHHTRRLQAVRPQEQKESLTAHVLMPPAPPIQLTESVASDPDTDPEILWHIARHIPHLRRWVVVNRSADARLLEYISQQGGPGVKRALELVLSDLESDQ